MRNPKLAFNRIQPSSISAKILISLGEVGDLSRVYVKNKKVLQNNLNRLSKRGLIRIVSSKKNVLSEDGLIEFLKLELSQTELLPKNKICMVVFDIPEKSKKWREVLRKFLEDTCFIQLQKSVWISQFNAAKLLSKIFRLLKINKWVRVFIATETTESQ